LDLDRQQQFRDSLNLVDYHSARVIDESDGVGDRRLSECLPLTYREFNRLCGVSRSRADDSDGVMLIDWSLGY